MSDYQAQSDPSAGGATVGADLGMRLGAKLIDFVILWIVYLVVLVPILFTALLGGASMGFGFSGSTFIASLISFALYLGYFVLMESMTGRTLGKMLLKMRVQGEAGGNPTFEEALRRNAWLALGIVPVLGGLAVLAIAIYILVTISNSATNAGWHDQFGGTIVLKEG